MNASTINYRNDISTNNNSNSNLSMLIRSKVNSTFCTINKDDAEHNTKQKYEDAYNIYNPQNNEFNKNRTMSNIKPSRNNTNYFTLLNNKPSNKNMNISQQNTLMNINSYLQKNFSSNSLRKNSSNSNIKKNYTNTSSKKKDFKQNNNHNSSLNITNNTYNMNKNNIMINVNPKNISTNMNIEKLKVQKKLYEYQRLIDQKLNELIKNRHFAKNYKNTIHIRRNSSPNYNNSQRKSSVSAVGLEYYLKKNRKKSITPNTNSHLNKNNSSKKQIVRQIRERKSTNHRNNSQSQSVKKNRCNVTNINNMKQNLNKAGYFAKTGEDYVENCKQDKDDNNNNNNNINGKINLSLRKFIFTKCGNSSSNNINKKY